MVSGLELMVGGSGSMVLVSGMVQVLGLMVRVDGSGSKDNGEAKEAGTRRKTCLSLSLSHTHTHTHTRSSSRVEGTTSL